MEEKQIYHDQHADLNVLNDRIISVIGYGSQGRNQALCLRDSGLKVIIGARENGPSWNKAKDDGFEVYPVSEACYKSSIIHLLVPDELHQKVYEENIKQHLVEGKALSCSHGFNISFKRIIPPENVDVIMVAPKSPGTEERKAFREGFGVPGLIAIHQNYTGKAKDIALAMAKGIGLTHAGVLECTFDQETFEDLFGEQTVLCGGIVELMKKGFETLVEAGYPPEMAYFECVHEVKLIVDLIYEGGLGKMYDVVSNTAEYGGMTVGPKIIDDGVKDRMKEALRRIEQGEFAAEIKKEFEDGHPNLDSMRNNLKDSLIEKTGARIRNLFQRR